MQHFLTASLRDAVTTALVRCQLQALTDVEPELWAFVELVAWPDPSPEFDGLMEHAEAAAARARARFTLVECVAIMGTYFSLASAQTLAILPIRDAIELPREVMVHKLGDYLVLQGEARYRAAQEDPKVAVALAATPGFQAHNDALVSIVAVFEALVETASDEDLEAVIRVAARRDVDDPPSQSIVCHPSFGYGVVQWRDGGPLQVVFADGERTLPAHEDRWSDPRGVFRDAAQLALTGAPPLAEDRFWEVVATLDWQSGATARKVAPTLAAALDADGQLAFASRRYAVHRQLERRVEAWEESTGTRVSASDDGMNDLLNHVVGLGRHEYEAAMADPARVALRAERRDYRESFAYVEQYAWQEVPLDRIRTMLREKAVPDLVDDPARGLGLRTPEGVVFAWD